MDNPKWGNSSAGRSCRDGRVLFGLSIYDPNKESLQALALHIGIVAQIGVNFSKNLNSNRCQ